MVIETIESTDAGNGNIAIEVELLIGITFAVISSEAMIFAVMYAIAEKLRS